MKNKQIRIRCWIDIDGVKFFGPGRAELLELIDQEGSIAKAAKKMGMSYKKAWDMVDEMNTRGVKPFVISRKGGAQVPVFIDGVPVYVPYDGYVDMGRFTTVDLAQVSVSKGFASILYGRIPWAAQLIWYRENPPVNLRSTEGSERSVVTAFDGM